MRRKGGTVDEILEKVRSLSPEERRAFLDRLDESLREGGGAGPQLSAEDQQKLWKEWCDMGPQGPIEDEGEPEFP